VSGILKLFLSDTENTLTLSLTKLAVGIVTGRPVLYIKLAVKVRILLILRLAETDKLCGLSKSDLKNDPLLIVSDGKLDKTLIIDTEYV
jgi:hypothetical protein